MRAMRIGWLVYGVACAAVPILWGLAVYRILRGRAERRRIPPRYRSNETGPTGWDYNI